MDCPSFGEDSKDVEGEVLRVKLIAVGFLCSGAMSANFEISLLLKSSVSFFAFYQPVNCLL